MKTTVWYYLSSTEAKQVLEFFWLLLWMLAHSTIIAGVTFKTTYLCSWIYCWRECIQGCRSKYKSRMCRCNCAHTGWCLHYTRQSLGEINFEFLAALAFAQQNQHTITISSIGIQPESCVTLAGVGPSSVGADLLTGVCGIWTALIVLYIFLQWGFKEGISLEIVGTIPSHANLSLLRVYPVLQLHL